VPRATLITPSEAWVVEALSDTSLMQAAVNAGVSGIVGECAGNMSCGTCQLYVAEAWLARLPEMSAAENEMLGAVASERSPNSRLACQIELRDPLNGLVVYAPMSQY